MVCFCKVYVLKTWKKTQLLLDDIEEWRLTWRLYFYTLYRTWYISYGLVFEPGTHALCDCQSPRVAIVNVILVTSLLVSFVSEYAGVNLEAVQYWDLEVWTILSACPWYTLQKNLVWRKNKTVQVVNNFKYFRLKKNLPISTNVSLSTILHVSLSTNNGHRNTVKAENVSQSLKQTKQNYESEMI